MTATRNFLQIALSAGLACRTITPEDILRHLTPEVLAAHLPVTLKAKLLSASLKAERLSPALIVESVEVQGLAAHMPEHLLWQCIVEAAERGLGSAGSKGTEEVLSGKPRSAAVPTTLFRGGTSDKVARPAAARRPNVSRRPARLTGATTAGQSSSRSSREMEPRPEDSIDGWRAPAAPAGSDAEALGAGGDVLADWADEHTITGDTTHQRKS